jgi:hypothetical protein
MKPIKVLLACALLLGTTIAVEAQKAKPAKSPSSVANTEQAVRAFYDAYAEDLRQHRRAAIAERYDRRGVYFLGNGSKTLESYEAVKTSYLTKWTGPKSFGWQDLSVEVLSPNAAVVLARFAWQTDKGETMTFSYTGVVLRQAGQWRIRVEDESRPPSKPPTQ